MKKVNIIFILGHIQTLMLPIIIDGMNGPVFVFSSHKIVKKKGLYYINLKPKFYIIPISLIRYLHCVLYMVLARRIDLYTPHLMNFVANKIYYSNVKKIGLSFLFDGILNYRDVDSLSSEILKYQNKQKRKSLLLLHDYVYSRNGVVDKDLQKKTTLLVPGFALIDRLRFSGKIKILKQEKKAASIELPGTALILGPGGNVNLNDFMGSVVNFFTEKSITTFYYKPHPSSLGKEVDFRQLREMTGVNVLMIDKSVSAEFFFQENRCEYIISGLSSALISIKSFDPDVQVACVIDRRITEQEPSLEGIVSLMREMKIDILYSN